MLLIFFHKKDILMNLKKNYQTCVLTIIMLLVSFSVADAAYYPIEGPNPVSHQIIKSKKDKIKKQKKSVVKQHWEKAIVKRLKKDRKREKGSIVSSTLSFVLGIFSLLALVTGGLVLLFGGSMIWIVVAFIAALAGIVTFALALIAHKKEDSPGSIVLAIIGGLSSLLSAIIAGAGLYESL